MATSCDEKRTVSPSTFHPDVKQQRQHCSLFNLDLFSDDQSHPTNRKNLTTKQSIDQCCCSSSTPNVDDACQTNSLPHSCSFVVLQKNYTTQLEHVAETLLADENPSTNPCSYCSTLDAAESKPSSSLNRKLLFGSAAILDSFLRNNVRTSANTSLTVTSSTGSSQRRWHSERVARHPNVRANLPLTPAQREVLERYMNYPLMKPSPNVRPMRRSHLHQPITGKAGEATGTALSALAEQPISHTPMNTRPLSSTSSSPSAASHHSVVSNQRCCLVDTIPSRDDDKDDDDDEDNDTNDSSSSSEFDSSSDEETSEIIQSSILPIASVHQSMPTESLSECSICCEMRRLQKRSCCQFDACNTCLNIYVEQQVKQGLVRIQCPNQGCHSYLHRDEIYKRCTSAELRQKLTRFLADANRASNIKTCPRCSDLHEIDLELSRSKRRAPTKVQCVQCNLIWCFQCHSPWHDGIQCREFRRGDRMLRKWAQEVHYGQQNAQQCPSCKVYIQRTKGCDHIVCVRCKTEFCYKCGDRFRDIKFIGDHYSELSVLGCKYRFYPDRPVKRRLIRGSILGGKILAAPVVLCFAVVAGTVCATVGLPAYCCVMLARHIKAKRRRRRHATLKEPVLMSYKTLNEMVPQLIPRDPVNSNGVKMPFHPLRTTLQTNETINVEIDPTTSAPIAVLDECDTQIPSSAKEQSISSIPITSVSSSQFSTTSPNFPRLAPFHTRRILSPRSNL